MLPPLLTPAKINLYLHVIGKRANGMHELSSLVAFATIGDTVLVRRGQKDKLTTSGPAGHGIKGPFHRNLVAKAVSWLRRGGKCCHPMQCHIDKTIPLQGGLGGGSGNAATIIRCAFATRQDLESWCQKHYGALYPSLFRLGADVPVCLDAEPAWVSGLGEVITKLDSFPTCGVVLLLPPLGIPTVDAFSLWQTTQPSNNPQNRVTTDQKPPSFETYDALITYLKKCQNDLEPAARRISPQFDRIATAWHDMKAFDISRMSGSGSTLFGLLRHEPSHEVVADLITKTHDASHAFYKSRIMIGRLSAKPVYPYVWANWLGT